MPLRQLADVAAILAELEADPAISGPLGSSRSSKRLSPELAGGATRRDAWLSQRRAWCRVPLQSRRAFFLRIGKWKRPRIRRRSRFRHSREAVSG
jgi:hypothetical protein